MSGPEEYLGCLAVPKGCNRASGDLIPTPNDRNSPNRTPTMVLQILDLLPRSGKDDAGMWRRNRSIHDHARWLIDMRLN